MKEYKGYYSRNKRPLHVFWDEKITTGTIHIVLDHNEPLTQIGIPCNLLFTEWTQWLYIQNIQTLSAYQGLGLGTIAFSILKKIAFENNLKGIYGNIHADLGDNMNDFYNNQNKLKKFYKNQGCEINEYEFTWYVKQLV